MKKTILFFALAIVSFGSFAQHCGWRTYTTTSTSSTLRSNYVYSVIQDRVGDYWFGTWGGGVSKFDGTNWTIYTINDGLANDSVIDMIQDSAGNYWFGTFGGGVSKFDGTHWTTYTASSGLAGNYVVSVFQDSAGDYWFGTLSGVSRFDGAHWTTYTTNNGLVSDTVTVIFQDHAGDYWFGTMDKGVSKYDGTTWTTYNINTTDSGLADNEVWSIIQDHAGDYWFGTGGGVCKFDDTTWTIYNEDSGLVDNHVGDIMQDSAGNYWFSTQWDGISKFDGVNTWTTYNTDSGLANDGIFRIIQDTAGNYWFATMGGGVSKFDGGNTWTTYAMNGLEDDNIRFVIQDSIGDYWFATYGGGVSKYDGSSWTTYTLNNTDSGLISNRVCFAMQDSAGNYWFTTDGGGVSKFDGTHWTAYTTDSGLVSRYVFFAMQDNVGNYWFATISGVSKFDGSTWTTYKTDSGLANNDVNAIIQDRDGNYWFATYGGGVSKFDGTHWTTYNTDSGLADNKTYSIIQDAAGNFWIGTRYGGVSKFDGTSWTTYDTTNGLAENDVRFVMQDKEGNYWFGTYNEGITRFDGTSWTTYTTDSGLADNRIWSIIQDKSGEYWIGTNRGANRFNFLATPANINLGSDTTICEGNQLLLHVNGQFKSYQWQDNSMDSTFLVNTQGEYTVKVTDTNNCVATDTIHVQIDNISIAVDTIVNLRCYGGTDAFISINAINGADGTYSYLWGTGDTLNTLSNLSAGSYSVVVDDSNGCQAIDTFVITQPDSISITIDTIINSLSSDGAIYVSVTGGTPGYLYDWNNDTTDDFDDSQDIAGLSMGTYTLVVKDTNQCTASISATIKRALLLEYSQINENCHGQAIGQVTISITSGTPPYDYRWSTGDSLIHSTDTSYTLSNLSAGTYSVTVTDSNNISKIHSFIITEPLPLEIISTISPPALQCYGDSNATISLSVSGGTGTVYSYLWSTGDTTNTITNLSAGSYLATVTDSNGCTQNTFVTVYQPTKLILSVNVDSIQCYGDTNGAIDLNVSGGIVDYTYAWNTGDSVQNISSLYSGSYTVTVTDHNGCTQSTTVVLSQPDSISIAIDSIKNSSGSNGAIYVSVTGGAGNYVYDWNNDETGDFDDFQDVTDLSANTYTLVVKDENQCTNTIDATVDSSNLGIVSSQKNVDCYGNATGEASVFITSGTPPYNYRWSSGDSLIHSTDTSYTLSNLSAGTYSVTVTDNDNTTRILSFTITEPSPIVVMSMATELQCYGDTNASITLDVNGGTGSSYSYLWNTGDTTDTLINLPVGDYSVTVMDDNGCEVVHMVNITQPAKLTASTTVLNNASSESVCDGSATVTVAGGNGIYQYAWNDGNSQTTDTATNLCAGTYTVTVSDSNHCQVTDSVTILIETSPLTVSISSQDPKCYGSCDGYAVAVVNGGESPYAIQWNDPKYQTTDTAKNLCAGTYMVTITDHNGLTVSDSITLIDPDKLDLSIAVINASCGKNDGLAQVTVNSGSGDYSYEWSNGDQTNIADSLSAGTGHILVTDNHTGCSTTQYFTIENADAPVLALSGKNIACNGASTGEISLTVTGSAEPYKVMWSNGVSTSLNGATASQTINNLSAGTYEVDVIDTNGCLSHGEVVLTENTAISLSFNTTNASCGHSDGNIGLTVSGGTTPYTVQWNTGDTTTMLNDLLSGNYSVTVSDSNGCNANGVVAVADSGSPILSIDTIIAARCNQTGAILITATEVDTSATYLWDSTIVGKDLTEAEPGNHTLIVNSNGCKAVLNVTVPYILPQPQPLCMVSVDSATTANLIVWKKQDTTAIDHYNIYREGSTNEYFLLGSRSADSMSYFIDSSAYSWIRSYRYKISVVDKCGNESVLSPLHKTIHLTINLAYTTNHETKANLIWDDYEGFDYTSFYINQYSLENGWEVLDSLPRDLHSYTAVVPDSGAIYVVTVKRPGDACWATRNYSGPYAQSYSNVDDLRANGGGNNSDTTSDSTAIDLQNSIGNIALYPNPNDGSFTVTGNHIVAVDIYNANGQLIEQHRTATVNHLFLKPKAKLTEGIYFVKIMTQNAIVVKKIMVQ